MNDCSLFLVFLNGEPEGVMTFGEAIRHAWDMDHADLYLEKVSNQEAQHD